jgi:hypothetical protein
MPGPPDQNRRIDSNSILDRDSGLATPRLFSLKAAGIVAQQASRLVAPQRQD